MSKSSSDVEKIRGRKVEKVHPPLADTKRAADHRLDHTYLQRDTVGGLESVGLIGVEKCRRRNTYRIEWFFCMPWQRLASQNDLGDPPHGGGAMRDMAPRPCRESLMLVIPFSCRATDLALSDFRALDAD